LSVYAHAIILAGSLSTLFLIFFREIAKKPAKRWGCKVNLFL